MVQRAPDELFTYHLAPGRFGEITTLDLGGGGPPVTGPGKKGFGTRLIERVLAADFGGHAKTDYRPDGVVYELVAPMVGSAAKSG